MEEIKIFISYAHKDDAYFRVFKEGIESHSSKIKWKIWCDKEIPTGSLWHNAIQEEIKTCNAAILLVSANFLSSNYIENEEFLHFLERTEKDGFIFLPILLSDCDFTQWENLANRQFFYPQGIDYGLSRLTNISYSHLVEFNRDLIALPNAHRETYHKKCVKAFEEVILSKQDIQQNLISKDDNSSLISALSNKDILNALNLFQGQIKERELNEKELADALDTKIKLYNAIFRNFDNQLDTTYKNNLASVVFDRIIFASEHIQKLDIDTIQKFRNNKLYEDRDRSLIVSGLTVSLLNHFDSKKIHLLIDFLTDFEEEVWQKALVGLLFALTRYNNRLSLFPEIGKRLDELKEITNIQKALCVIDRVLRHGSFSNKKLYKRNPSSFVNMLKILVGNSVDISQEDLIEMQNNLSTTTIDGRMMNSLFRKEIIDKFICALENTETITMSVEEFFNLLDFDTYIELYELNPFQVNLTDNFFKTSRNWFMPFKDNEDIRNILANNFTVDDIDILDFISMIQQSTISNIDKNYILTHIKQFSDDFIYTIYIFLFFDISSSRNISTLELIITKTIRDLYRFSKLSVISLNNNLFDEKLSIYGQSLLEKIANNITEIKINSQYLYDNDKHEESLRYLQNVPNNEYDFEILELFVNNHIALEQDEKAAPYLNELLALFENKKTSVDDSDKAKWYKKTKWLYRRLEEKEPNKYRNMYRAYLDKEILIREKIFRETFESEYNLFVDEEGTDLADCYFEENVVFWNYDNNWIESFSYIIKYLNVYFQIHSENNVVNLLQEIKQKQESITTVFQMISERNEIDIIQILNTKCKHTHKSLKGKIKELFSTLRKINDIEHNIEIVKQNCNIQRYAMYLSDIIFPVVKSVKEQNQDRYENIAIPFVFETNFLNLIFPINEFLQRKEDIVIEILFSNLWQKLKKEFCKQNIDLFFANLFFDEKLPSLSKKIIENSIAEYFLEFHIFTEEDNIKETSIELIRNLMNQQEYEIALSYLNVRLVSNPKDAIAWNIKGNCLFFLQYSHKEIIVCYDKAIKLDNNFQIALENRANVLIKMERYKEALKDCKKALNINPSSDYAKELKNEALQALEYEKKNKD